jgi:hypothetical protein
MRFRYRLTRIQEKAGYRKLLTKPQQYSSMITKIQGVHSVGVGDTQVILGCKARTQNEHGTSCV